MELKKELWAKTPAGEQIWKYTLKNSKGAYVELTNIGAGIVSLVVPDRNGILGDISLGYRNPLDYIGDAPCMGRIPGRFANRIAKGRFTLDGKEYQLPINNCSNSLHGGPNGFQNHLWESRFIGDAVEFKYVSPDGEAGYPGTLTTIAHYEWDEENTLKLTLMATTDAPTVLNFTHHMYMNLNGEGNGNIRTHILRLNGSEYLPSDAELIPDGTVVPVAGTPLDFLTPKPLGRDLEADHPSIRNGKGYDVSFFIDGAVPGQISEAADLYAPESGRRLKVYTTMPTVHIYTGNNLGGNSEGKHGHIYKDYDAVCIECQYCPDSPNRPEFPSTVLRPGETYNEAIIWDFSAE